jgi:hypothetical protein
MVMYSADANLRARWWHGIDQTNEDGSSGTEDQAERAFRPRLGGGVQKDCSRTERASWTERAEVVTGNLGLRMDSGA